LFDHDAQQMKQDELRSGEKLAGKYKILQPLGAGGHATVYLAQQDGLGRQVAIKVLRVRDANLNDRAEAVLIKRFDQEARLLSSLRDPHTVTMYDYGRTEHGTLYMVFEHIDGESLEDVLIRDGAMEPARVVKIVRQILESLQEAHAMGVLHRDIKPSNIMLYKHVGRADQVKVLDFGIAKIVSDQNPDMTAEGSIVGTPRYIAPERLREEEVPASDLYSVGMVAWEMLTGRAVLDGKSGMHALRAQIEQPSISLPTDLAVPLTLRQTMNKLMCKPLNQRYSAAEQVLLDLERWDVSPMFAEPGPDDSLSDDVTTIAASQTPMPRRHQGGPTTRESLMDSLHTAKTEFDPQPDLDQTSANLDEVIALTRQDMLAKWHAARAMEASASATLEAPASPSQPQLDPMRTLPMPAIIERSMRDAALPTMERSAAAVIPTQRMDSIGDDEATLPAQRSPAAPAQDATPEKESGASLLLTILGALLIITLIVGAAWYFTRMV
jgi:serine/threonine protein kinase